MFQVKRTIGWNTTQALKQSDSDIKILRRKKRFSFISFRSIKSRWKIEVGLDRTYTCPLGPSSPPSPQPLPQPLPLPAAAAARTLREFTPLSCGSNFHFRRKNYPPTTSFSFVWMKPSWKKILMLSNKIWIEPILTKRLRPKIFFDSDQSSLKIIVNREINQKVLLKTKTHNWKLNKAIDSKKLETCIENILPSIIFLPNKRQEQVATPES